MNRTYRLNLTLRLRKCIWNQTRPQGVIIEGSRQVIDPLPASRATRVGRRARPTALGRLDT